MNKCSLNEYDSFKKCIIKHQSQKNEKISNSKIILRIKHFSAHFPSEHHFPP